MRRRLFLAEDYGQGFTESAGQPGRERVLCKTTILAPLINEKSPLSTSIIHKTPSEHKPERPGLREEGSARCGFWRSSVERGSRGALLARGVKGSSPSWGGVAECWQRPSGSARAGPFLCGPNHRFLVRNITEGPFLSCKGREGPPVHFSIQVPASINLNLWA